MKRLAISPQFINKTGDDLIPGKIHSIRQNYDYWKKFEGKEVAIFTWEGKPYRSKQKVICVKKIVSVQKIRFEKSDIDHFSILTNSDFLKIITKTSISKNDGLSTEDFINWFKNYRDGEMAIIHFTNYFY